MLGSSPSPGVFGGCVCTGSLLDRPALTPHLTDGAFEFPIHLSLSPKSWDYSPQPTATGFMWRRESNPGMCVCVLGKHTTDQAASTALECLSKETWVSLFKVSIKRNLSLNFIILQKM